MSGINYLHGVIDQSGFTWVSDGRPKKVMPFKHAKREDHAAIEGFQKPAKFMWPVLLSAAQIWEFLEGFNPTNSDGKWFVYSDFEYADYQSFYNKVAPDNVNGMVKVHICHRATGRQIYQIDIDVEFIDIVVQAHPDMSEYKFAHDSMVVGIIDRIHYESSEELVGTPTVTEVKNQLKGICRSVLDIHLLVKGVEPVQMESRSNAERARAKFDMAKAMNRVVSTRMKLLTGGSDTAMSSVVSRMITARGERPQLYLKG